MKKEAAATINPDLLLHTLEQLLTLSATDTTSVLNQASNLLSVALTAEKIDVFLYDPAQDTLIAVATSDTPLAARQHVLGLDRLPLSGGGREVEVYRTGRTYLSGNVDLDTGVLRGFRYDLGVRSMILVPLVVDGERHGVIQVAAVRGEAFTGADLRFVQAVARWLGMILYSAHLVEQLAGAEVAETRWRNAEDLVAALAHDLNNHLTPIQGRVALLRRRATKEQRPQDVADLAALSGAVGRLGSLVTDLLDVERIEHGLFAISVETVELDALVSETVATLTTPERPIIFRLHTHEHVTVPGDPARLRQALENLLANATQHTPPGQPVTVTLATEQRDEGCWAALVVHDAGPGVPPDMVPRLFDRFAAGPDSTGLGLGLFMAHSITAAHKGTLHYQQGTQAGTSFQLALPLAEGRAGGRACT